MPCRNAAKTLGAALDSIQAQTFRDWELIVLDDGSSDSSAAVASARAAGDNRVFVRAEPHRGIVAALQTACAHARGRYIARMDADDVAEPDRLAQQLALMRSRPDTALCGTHVEMTGDTVRCGRRRYEKWLNSMTTHDEIVRGMFIECPLAHPTFMMRRDDFDAVGGYVDNGWAEDYDLCMRMYLAGMRFASVPKRLLKWREYPGRTSMSDPRYSPRKFRILKRHYLMQSHLAGRAIFHQWGAGEIGKPWLREWQMLKPEAVVDINPRKIGETIHRVPVIPAEQLPPPGQTFVIIAVGAPGARREIRQWLLPRGYVEMRDFLFVA